MEEMDGIAEDVHCSGSGSDLCMPLAIADRADAVKPRWDNSGRLQGPIACKHAFLIAPLLPYPFVLSDLPDIHLCFFFNTSFATLQLLLHSTLHCASPLLKKVLHQDD